MKALIAVCLVAFTMAHAVAAAQPHDPVRVISKSRHAVGAPQKASSFAPHPGSKRRVYGAPIQRPILTHVRPKQPIKPK